MGLGPWIRRVVAFPRTTGARETRDTSPASGDSLWVAYRRRVSGATKGFSIACAWIFGANVVLLAAIVVPQDIGDQWLVIVGKYVLPIVVGGAAVSSSGAVRKTIMSWSSRWSFRGVNAALLPTLLLGHMPRQVRLCLTPREAVVRFTGPDTMSPAMKVRDDTPYLRLPHGLRTSYGVAVTYVNGDRAFSETFRLGKAELLRSLLPGGAVRLAAPVTLNVMVGDSAQTGDWAVVVRGNMPPVVRRKLRDRYADAGSWGNEFYFVAPLSRGSDVVPVEVPPGTFAFQLRRRRGGEVCYSAEASDVAFAVPVEVVLDLGYLTTNVRCS